ncbi:MAG: threo-3-hydroxy-L-aspartate ammonia-lyase [Acidimicrobiia bacterium]|nr:threo-3-hydroxy-L-aspartate ammonia-lyase [Acidimicrobiia bacterium]NNL97382.1 threo-3-hydroxy-L-aspartate ammonia-lyase [Acidimicrobiia bacterium]
MRERLVTLDNVESAAARLEGVANRTPVVTSSTLNKLVGAEVFLKAECFQRTGSFKFRGAYNALSRLQNAARLRGVTAYSSGNHAQAVALSAALHDVRAVILMPEDSPSLKLAATRGYGAEVVYFDRYSDKPRHERGLELAEERGIALIPPFDHWDVIAGQGTTALELFQDAGHLDSLLVCVGGGGLISGCATVAKAQSGAVQVIGVEPEAGNDAVQSMREGRIVTIPTPRTIADGQQTTSVGERTFAVMKERVDDVVTVSDAEIVAAMRFAFERLHIVLEPSGASALAAVLSRKVDLIGQRVGVTLSGGNIGVERFVELMGEYPAGT